MTSPQASIQWDAADYYRVVQDYFSRELHAGRLPFWSPYPWCGYPFLADPQVGAWYPLNWPFFLLGVSSRVLAAEHCLHALVAAFGAYFLALRLIRQRQAAVLAGLCYGLSGFFAGLSSQTTIVQCAAWAPWLLLFLDRALESHPRRNLALAGLAAGLMILAGHFQVCLYSFLALGLFAAVRAFEQRRHWLAVMGLALAIPIIGAFVSAIATAPGLELATHSVRASYSALEHHEGQVPLAALTTLVYPDFYGVLSDDYTGPYDITQYYYYSGIVLVPLAILGLSNRSVRRISLALVIPTVWYSMGHAAGLYLLMARLPGFSSIRRPVHIWFVPILGLALMAAAGLAALDRRLRLRWLATAIVLATCVDLFLFESALNPLAYDRETYQDAYQSGEDQFVSQVARQLPPFTRFGAPDYLIVFGPVSHFLDTRTEVTYGYGPLGLGRYKEYTDAAVSNPSLRNGLNVSLWYDSASQTIAPNPHPLPRVTFPAKLVPVKSERDSRDCLRTLDQSREALVPADVFLPSQDGNGVAEIREFAPGHYRIHYRAAAGSLLRVSNAYFPGWTAESAGRRLRVVPVDHALTGVIVPPGEGDVDLNFHSTYFLSGALISLLAVMASIAAAIPPRAGHAESKSRSRG